MTATQQTSAQRMAAGYFLGLGAVVLVILLWLRGGGRLVLPLLLAGVVAVVVTRIVRAIKAPLP